MQAGAKNIALLKAKVYNNAAVYASIPFGNRGFGFKTIDIEISNPINQEEIKKHYRIVPAQSKYLYRKPEREKSFVSLGYFLKIGFFPAKTIVKAIDD